MADRPRHKRKLKNYLLDSHFQLRYAGFMFGVALVLSAMLGFLLWRTSQTLISQSQQAVEKGQQVVELGQKVAEESRKVSKVVEMNIVKDPFYADQPELMEAFTADAKKTEAVIITQQQALEAQAQALTQQSADLAESQRTMLYTLFGMLTLLVFGVGIAGIIVTHKVAGPIFKMTRQINDLADGHWYVPAPLRKGDELVHFFDAFRNMVEKLRAQRQLELEMLDKAMEELGDDAAPLDALRDELAGVLERRSVVDRKAAGRS